MRLYRIKLTLHSYATTVFIEKGFEMGNYVQPSIFIHNYSLIYAFNGIGCEYMIYCNQKPYNFVETLILSGSPIYATPARPLTIKLKGFTYTVKSEYYIEKKSKPSISAPSSGYYMYIAPYSVFEMFIVAEDVNNIPKYIRFGKKREGIFEVRIEEVNYRKAKGEAHISIPFNSWDAKNSITGQAKLNTLLSIRVPSKVEIERGNVVNGVIEGLYLEVDLDKSKECLLLPKQYYDKL